MLEIKGEEDEHGLPKATGARCEVDAVNHARRYGHWHYEVCEHMDVLRTKIEEVVNLHIPYGAV